MHGVAGIVTAQPSHTLSEASACILERISAEFENVLGLITAFSVASDLPGSQIPTSKSEAQARLFLSRRA